MYIAHVGIGIYERLKKVGGGLARGEFLAVSDTTYLNTHSPAIIGRGWRGGGGFWPYITLSVLFI